MKKLFTTETQYVEIPQNSQDLRSSSPYRSHDNQIIKLGEWVYHPYSPTHFSIEYVIEFNHYLATTVDLKDAQEHSRFIRDLWVSQPTFMICPSCGNKIYKDKKCCICRYDLRRVITNV